MIVDAEILRDSAQQFVARSYSFPVRQASIVEQGSLVPDHWGTFAELGWLGAALPEDAGGLGGSIAEMAVILEHLGKALIAAPLLGCAVLAAQVYCRAADAQAIAETLPRIAAGELRLALAHEEDSARGRLDHVSTSAHVYGDGYRLSGSKLAALGAPDCHQLIVSARLDGDLALFVIDPEAAGLMLQSYIGYDGLRAANVTFDNVQLPAVALLARGEKALSALRWGYDQLIMAEGAVQLGVMQVAFEHTRDYLKTRRQFGKALAEFQVLQHRLADIYVNIAEARALHASVVAQAQRFGTIEASAMAAMAYRMRQAGRFVAMQAVQLHGGIGMTDEYLVGHCCRYLIAAGLRHGDPLRQLDAVAAGLAA